ncbi:MAG: hypothetical protein HYU64_00610 [Armatimonadetes bacterium]|nr:hypothetical protein [Armatimonadota bacterium]
MAHAYTPGLKIASNTVIRKERRLPLKGDVLVKVGDPVKAETVVARTFLPGNVKLLNVANKLGIEAPEVPSKMLKREGDDVRGEEVIARSSGLFGLFKSECAAPASGTLESISSVTGQVVIREPSIPVEVKAFVEGVIERVMEDEGVVVRTHGTFIQGIFGIGGEVWGNLVVLAKNPDDLVQDFEILPEHKGKVLVCGSLLTAPAIQKARKVGATGMIGGGIDDQDLRQFLGYDLGVAITGSEDLGITLITTEGFGSIRIADKTFRLLCDNAGRLASINGATQIRAGVIRPEVIVPDPSRATAKPTPSEEAALEDLGMIIGCPVRVIREPYFGRLARVVGLPVELQPLETEARVRVVEVEFEENSGKGPSRAILPRANVELIEELDASTLGASPGN